MTCDDRSTVTGPYRFRERLGARFHKSGPRQSRRSCGRRFLGMMSFLGTRPLAAVIFTVARKYAPASPIDMQVAKTADVAVIEVADAGRG
jgi:hypothetical protein